MSGRIDSRAALRALAGLAAGLVAWVAFSPLYDRVVAASATVVMRAFERPPVTRLRELSDSSFAVDRSDFDPRSQRPVLAIRTLTVSFILLAMLFALEKVPFSDRNILAFCLASALVFASHVLGVIAKVKSIYAIQLGLWSTVNYSPFERNLWGGAAHAYEIVLTYGFAVAAWWICRSPTTATTDGPRTMRRRKG